MLTACWLAEDNGYHERNWPWLQGSTSLARSGCLWLVLAALHPSEAMLTAGFSGHSTVIVKALQYALLSISAATVTLMHVYEVTVGILSCTAVQVTLLLGVECSAD